jgi:hypothetical protein
MQYTIYSDRSSLFRDVEELREKWLDDLFIFIGLDIIKVKEQPKDVILDYFIEKEIELIYYVNMQAVKVKHKGELIGEWAGPESKLMEDKGGNLYFKTTIETWSISEEQLED